MRFNKKILIIIPILLLSVAFVIFLMNDNNLNEESNVIIKRGSINKDIKVDSQNESKIIIDKNEQGIVHLPIPDNSKTVIIDEL